MQNAKIKLCLKDTELVNIDLSTGTFEVINDVKIYFPCMRTHVGQFQNMAKL